MISVVACDAGGAEILSSYVRQRGLACLFTLAGPAVGIFEGKLGPIEVVPLEVSISQTDWLLCGTGGHSDLEWQAIRLSKQFGKRSVVFLDHWANYRKRFIRGGELLLPDEIWVGDSLAEDIAQKIFPSVKITVVENPYFIDIKRELSTIVYPDVSHKTGLNVLFVSAPLREIALRAFENERHFGYVEEEALDFFLSNAHVLGGSLGRVVLRRHPSEELHKYDWVTQQYSLPIVTGGTKTLLEEIAESDVVVGFDSMAMVVGLIAGKRVINCIPPGGQESVLPQPEIESLQSLLTCKLTS